MAKQIKEIVELMFENFADVWKIRSKIILEGMEALVTKNLYKILRLRREHEIQENEILEKKMKIIGSFIKPEHLDIDPKRLNHARVERAIAELQKMNKFKTPRDKMVLIMNACKVIGLMLKETNKDDIAEGADMFFPTIIYCLLKGCPKDIKAHVDFIKLYRHHELLESEEDYFLTTMTSAIDFISNMIGDDLNIEKSEYKDLYDKYAEENGQEINDRVQKRQQMKKDRQLDDFENQSDVSVLTTQSNAQILGELEALDVPIICHSLTLSKGIQTEVHFEEKKESRSDNFIQSDKEKSQKSCTSASSNSNPLISQIESKVFSENETFWKKQLKDDFESMTISEVKEMHRIMLDLKNIFANKPHEIASPIDYMSLTTAPNQPEKQSPNEDDFLLFGGEPSSKEQDDQNEELKKNGLDGLDAFF